MKINEILAEQQLEEGPLDSLKNLGANFTSGLRGGAKMGTRNDQGRFTKAGTAATAANKLGKGVATAANKLGKGVKAGVAGYQQHQAQRQGAEAISDYAKSVIQKWNQRAGGTGDTDIVGWASKFFNADLSKIPAPDINNTAGVNDYLTNVTKLYKSEKLSPPQVVQKQQQQTTQQQPQQDQNNPPPLRSPEEVVDALKKRYPQFINDIAAILIQQRTSGVAK
jgi:hypothetical protein